MVECFYSVSFTCIYFFCKQWKKNLLKKRSWHSSRNIASSVSYIHCGASTRSQRKKPLNVFNMSFPCCALVRMMDLLQLELLVHTVKEKRKKKITITIITCPVQINHCYRQHLIPWNRWPVCIEVTSHIPVAVCPFKHRLWG